MTGLRAWREPGLRLVPLSLPALLPFILSGVCGGASGMEAFMAEQPLVPQDSHRSHRPVIHPSVMVIWVWV